MRNKWFRTALLGMLVGVVLVGCQNSNTKTDKTNQTKEETQIKSDAQTETFTYTKYDVDVKDKVVLGEENALNTIVLAFDYSCPWCHKWIAEVLPELEKKYIETEKAKFVSQPLVLLNELSLSMAKVDKAIEEQYPGKYYEIQREVLKDAEAVDNWGTDSYFLSTLQEHGIQTTIKKLKNENAEDPITITRNYTKNLGLEYVPTVYVNGIKTSDPFNIDDIEKIINGEIKNGDVTQIKKTK